jgi:hypothetical protein
MIFGELLGLRLLYKDIKLLFLSLNFLITLIKLFFLFGKVIGILALVLILINKFLLLLLLE